MDKRVDFIYSSSSERLVLLHTFIGISSLKYEPIVMVSFALLGLLHVVGCILT